MDDNSKFDQSWNTYMLEPNNRGKNGTMRKSAARAMCGFLNQEVDFSNIPGEYVTKENVIDALRNI